MKILRNFPGFLSLCLNRNTDSSKESPVNQVLLGHNIDIANGLLDLYRSLKFPSLKDGLTFLFPALMQRKDEKGTVMENSGQPRDSTAKHNVSKIEILNRSILGMGRLRRYAKWKVLIDVKEGRIPGRVEKTGKVWTPP